MTNRVPMFGRLIISTLIIIAAVTACDASPLPESSGLITRARQSWMGNWHAVWQIEWSGAPVRGPLVAEVWHAADGRLRIETLEAPTAALSGLTSVNDGATAWLYDLRQNRAESGPADQVRIPLASDALNATDWLLKETSRATTRVTGRDMLESGLADRLAVIVTNGDRAMLWVHEETGLPARVELHSAIWGEATFAARSIDLIARQPDKIFTFWPPPGVEVITRP